MTCCKAMLVAATMPHGEAETLGGWLSEGTDDFGRPVSAETMAKALSVIGRPVGKTTLKEHRRGYCVCADERTVE